LNADEGVAKGAAIMAGILSGQLTSNDAREQDMAPPKKGAARDKGEESDEEMPEEMPEDDEEVEGVVVNDVTPLSFGLAVANGDDDDDNGDLIHSVLINRNSMIPCLTEKKY